jgi:hypothetical protein
LEYSEPNAYGARRLLRHHFYTSPRRPDRAKTGCTSAVLAELGIDCDRYRYSGTIRQTTAVARRFGWQLSRFRAPLRTVNQTLPKLRERASEDASIVAYMVFVTGHVLLLDHECEVVIDTQPHKGKSDRRKLTEIYEIRLPHDLR